MRIIYQMELPETKIKCDSCQSILAYTQADENNQIEEFCGELHDHDYIICPVCKNKIITRIDGEKV